jgi:YHS domain-containing protein
MLRFLVIVLLVLILYYLLHFFIKDMPSARGRRDPGPEELVQDPCCQTYIPKRTALRKRVGGRDLYFCNQECFKRFLERGRG